MQYTSVSSSNLREVGYERASQTLEIEFHNGGVYQYSGVPQSVHNALISAASVGSYFHAHIKDVYPCNRLR